MAIISLVVAAAEDGAIGKDNQLPWRLPDDLKFFKKTTLGKPILMGRKTWESLGGRPLPGRVNVVLSSAEELALPEGVLHFRSLQDAISHFASEEEIMVIGGGQIFREVLPSADRIYYTAVHTTVPGAGATFPPINEDQWKKVWDEPHPADEKHAFAFNFQLWERK